jgi:hypothetical protein
MNPNEKLMIQPQIFYYVKLKVWEADRLVKKFMSTTEHNFGGATF